jgi:O-antigen ligase/tetratricopeptide (TPR) repeat protein
MRTFYTIDRLILSFILAGVPLVVYSGVGDPNTIKILVFRALLLLWGLAFLSIFFWKRNVKLAPTNLALGVVLWLLISVFSMFHSDYKIVGADNLVSLLCFVCFFFLVGFTFSIENRVESALGAAVFGASIVSIYGIFQYMGISFFEVRDTSRVFSTFGHPNFLGSYLSGTIPLTIGLFFSGQGTKKYYFGFSILLQSVCLFLTFARGAFLSLMIAMVFFYIGHFKMRKGEKTRSVSRRSWVQIFVFLIVISTLFLIIGQNLPRTQINRLTKIWSPSPENTFWLRWLEWQGALKVIKRAPILGHGIGTFSINFPENQPFEFSRIAIQRNEFLRHAHNEYLELWCEMGILGPLVVLFTLISAMYTGIGLLNQFQKDGEFPAYWFLGLLSALFGIGFNMLFSVSFRFLVLPLFFWFFLGTIYGLSQNVLAERTGQPLSGKASFLMILFLILGVVFLSFSTIKALSFFKSEKGFYRGMRTWKSGDLNGSLMYFDQALKDNAKKPELYYKKGALLVLLEEWSDALKTYRTLMKLNPNFFHINYNLSICYLHLEEFKSAVVSGERELELYPDFVKQYFILGKAYFKVNDYHKARRNFEKYLASDPKNLSALIYLANIHSASGEWEKAISICGEVLKLQPLNFACRVNLFHTYMEKGDLQEALRNFCIALEEHYSTAFLEEKWNFFELMAEKLRKKLDDKSILKDCPIFSKYAQSGFQKSK